MTKPMGEGVCILSPMADDQKNQGDDVIELDLGPLGKARTKVRLQATGVVKDKNGNVRYEQEK